MINPDLYLISVIFSFVLTCIGVIIFEVRKARMEYQEISQQKLTVQEMEKCENIINAFLDKNNIHEYRSIWELGKTMNIGLGEMYGQSCPSASLSWTDKDGKRWVNFHKSLDRSEKTLAFAQICAKEIIRNSAVRKEKNHVEYAEYIAIALLIPAKDLRDWLNWYEYADARGKEQEIIVIKLQEQYQISRKYILKRIHQIQMINR